MVEPLPIPPPDEAPPPDDPPDDEPPPDDPPDDEREADPPPLEPTPAEADDIVVANGVDDIADVVGRRNRDAVGLQYVSCNRGEIDAAQVGIAQACRDELGIKVGEDA
jgi:hypothetical protein